MGEDCWLRAGGYVHRKLSPLNRSRMSLRCTRADVYVARNSVISSYATLIMLYILRMNMKVAKKPMDPVISVNAADTSDMYPK